MRPGGRTRRTPSWVTLGRHSYCHEVIEPWNAGSRLVVGSFTSLGSPLYVYGASNHALTITTYPFDKMGWKGYAGRRWSRGPITVGSDCWIGERVTLLSGITIGDGAVVGACSVVGSDVPAYAVAVGNPCRVIRYRFSPEVIEMLLRIRWWDWPDEVIAERLPEFTDTPEAFVARYGLR